MDPESQDSVCADNPYEQKLYSMFCGHDDQHKGWLTVPALQQLCTTLELKENGTKLIAALTDRCGTKGDTVRITFKAFKEELLHVLGTDTQMGTAASSPTTTAPVDSGGGDKESNGVSSPRSRMPKSASPTREVAPKLVMGHKKYGRRTRPSNGSQSSSDGEEEKHSQSESESENATQEQQIEGQGMSKVHRSASQTDVKRRRQPQTSSTTNSHSTKLKRCASLPARRNMAREFVRIRGASPNGPNEITQKHIKAPLDSSVESLDTSGYVAASTQMANDYQIVPSETVVDMWESAGIQNAMQLLKYDLGFDAEQVNIQQLSQAIEEELNGLRSDCPEDERISVRLMRAALSLNKAELSGLQVALKHLGEENQKLHAGNRDANDRVALMAQEVDERHATIEKTTQMEIRSLEQQHAERIRELSKQLEQDREQWSAQHAVLEGRIKSLEAEEQKLRAENSRLEERNGALEAEQLQQHKQLADLLETNIRLNTDICELEEQQNSAAFQRSDRENEEIMELMEKITRLQMENTDLRDRNDELCAEMDALVGELSVWKGRKSLVAALAGDQPQGQASVTANSPLVSSQATKRRGDSPSKSKIAEESPKLGKLRKCSKGDGETEEEEEGEEEDVDEVALDAELQKLQGSTNSSLVDELKARVMELEALLKEVKKPKAEGGDENKAEEESEEVKKCLNCEEMESSLELMRKEFDSLEDYWQSKLNEERVLFEEEQRVNDDKFNDLLQKMMEYEEQFASTMKKDEGRDARLSPIEERGILEQQYMDLEEELNGLKRILREKNEEIKNLRQIQRPLPSLVAAADPFNISIDATSPPQSPAASSPINYLWSQSTIQAPARDYQNPNWQQQQQRKEPAQQTTLVKELEMALDVEEAPIVVSPIQKPKPGQLRRSADDVDNCDRVSVASSGDRHSAATYNVATKGGAVEEVKDEDLEAAVAAAAAEEPKDLIDAVDKEELSKQQILLRQLQEDCKELVHRRDALLNELQQLNEMRPQLEKNFARTIHPSLTTRIQQLEQRNRQLQGLLKQQQVYTESLMHQTWQQQRVEISDLRSRLENQGLTVADQVQRLAKADILVKELFVENSHLRANIQRLEQQSMRNNYLFQQHPGAPPGLNGVPSFP